MKKLKEYLDGKNLYGDDFNIEQIKKWYSEEKEGFSSLVDNDYIYGYHELNKIHGYNKLKKNFQFGDVLSFGGARGDELLPIIDRINNIYIIEPSKKLRAKKIKGKKIMYSSPSIDGKLKFKDNYFDIITCFGTLHHIPNVSFVFQELVRVLNKDGYILIREPTMSMGNWEEKRDGLTKNERGIPDKIFDKIIKESGLEIISKHKIFFPLFRRINLEKYPRYYSILWIKIDYLLSKLFSWNNKYHATVFFHKIRPQCIFYVLKKKGELEEILK
jgi:SAM-dependent methyltransferase